MNSTQAVAEHLSKSAFSTPSQTLAIAATFTAEPLESSLLFWMQELGFPSAIEFAPYNQVFQQLLDPSSLLSQNRAGVNVVLLRLEDWQRYQSHGDQSHGDQVHGDQSHGEQSHGEQSHGEPGRSSVESNLKDWIAGMRAAIARTATPYIVCVCPPSPAVQQDPSLHDFFQSMEEILLLELSTMKGVHVIHYPSVFELYPVQTYDDPVRDNLGHIPYTSTYFAALGTSIARKIFAIKTTPAKVIVLDCDNTLWKGIVGEDGVHGIEVPAAWLELQRMMVSQQAAGMLICLCSKNSESDVLEVFEKRADMLLTLEHIVCWRINWLPKSENIRSLAAELNLGLDSFIFIDDNPVECAEVQANCPDVLTLQLPQGDDIGPFLRHVWAFDRLGVTDEDRQRTALYKQNIERQRFQQEASTISEFLAGLELTVAIREPSAEQLSRVAQLTQRTNQFNFTTIRRSESDIQQLTQRGFVCRTVEVRDRFGDYGLVGVMIGQRKSDALVIDTFLLSCRVLGRGVEHQMLRYLGSLAVQEGLSSVVAPYSPTKKNLPAYNFLCSLAAAHRQTVEGGEQFHFAADVLQELTYQPGLTEPTDDSVEHPQQRSNRIVEPIAASDHVTKSQRLGRIASELRYPEVILKHLESTTRSDRPSLSCPYVPPQTFIENQLVLLWCELLNLNQVGIQDNYFDLGGTSLLAVEVIAAIETNFGRKLPLTTLVEFPTIQELAAAISQPESAAAKSSLVLLHQGNAQPPLFLIHDGDGEVLLYRNLARRLLPERSVYGIQPYRWGGLAMAHTRIPDMARYYIEQMQTVQPTGPYLLGGMCAGGTIAFEVALQLQAQGQEIALLAIMDAADVEAPKVSGLVADQRLKRFSSVLTAGQEQAPLYTRLLSVLRKASRKLYNVATYEVRSRVTALVDTAKMAALQTSLDQKLPIAGWLQALSVRTIYLFAEHHYRPCNLLHSQIVLVRATQGIEGSMADEPYINLYSDPLLGWQQRTTQPVVVLDVPGGHSSMLQTPHVDVLAATLQNHLDHPKLAQL